MNVKISENTAVFKISEDEMNRLATGEALRQDVSLGGGVLSLAINVGMDDAATAVTLAGGDGASVLTLTVTPEQVQALRDMGKNRDGLCIDSGGIEAHLQVDMRKDSRPRAA